MSQPTISTHSTAAVPTTKTNVEEILADFTSVQTKGVSTAQAAAARESGYLNSYIYRRPGSSGYSSHITSPVLSGLETTKEVTVTPAPAPVEYNYGRPSPVPLNNWNYTGYTGSSQWTSALEQEIINAKSPLTISGHEFVNTGKYSGIYLNKHEVENWKGPVSIDQYRLNDDPNPEVIRKRLDKINYEQVCGVRYLQPTAQRPGDLIIRERAKVLPAAPPLVIRQEGERSFHQAALIYREAPPPPPPRVPEQVIEVETEGTVAPARRIIVEKLGSLPPKPQDVIVERWLPYKQQRRRVIYQRHGVAAPAAQRNVIIEWEAPEVQVQKVCKDLGVVEADPEEYIRKYGSELKQSHELPNCCEHKEEVVVSKPAPVVVEPPPQQHCHCSGYHGCHSCCGGCNSGCGGGCHGGCHGGNATNFGYGYHASHASHSHAHSHYGGGHQHEHHHSIVVPPTQSVTNHSVHQSIHESTVSASVNHGSHAHFITARSANYSESLPELEGDVDALRLIDLDRHGLSQYKSYVSNSTKHIAL